MRLLHYSDVENAYDRPERAGRLAGCIDARRDDETVVVGTGDDLGPGVLPMVEDGAQALDFFRPVRPDVETFGNHDFDYGLDAAREVVEASPQTWVSANVLDDGDPFADASATTIVERGDRRVGFVGVTDPQSSVPDALTVTDPVAAVRDGVADLRAEGVDRVVGLAHVRDDCLRDLASAADLDAVLAGHVHRERRDRIDGTLVVRPGANGRVVWEVELGERVAATCLEVDDAPCREEVAAALRSRMAESGLSDVVGTAADPIERDRAACFAGEQPITNFVTDAYRWAGNADVGYADTRMLRSGPPLSGEVTVADVVGLAPFAADLCVTRVSGGTLRDLVAQTVVTDERAERSPTDAAWWGHFSGMTVVWDRDDLAVREVRVDGDPLDPEAEYALATNQYVVGSDEFPAISPDHVIEAVGLQYDALVEYARELGVGAERDGRIVVSE